MLNHYTTKMTRPLEIWIIYVLKFLMLLYIYTRCMFFSLLPKSMFSYEMSFYQNPIKYCNMAIYCNTLKHNTQYGIDPYCFTPSTYAIVYIHVYSYVASSVFGTEFMSSLKMPVPITV